MTFFTKLYSLFLSRIREEAHLLIEVSIFLNKLLYRRRNSLYNLYSQRWSRSNVWKGDCFENARTTGR